MSNREEAAPGRTNSTARKYMLQEELAQEQPPGDANKSHKTLWDRLLAREGVLAYLPIIAVVILMFMGASWQFTWLHTDAARYQCYSLTFWFGGGAVKLLPGVQCAYLPASTLALPPFHALPLEYPPLTLVIFSLALFAPLVLYQMTFAIWMALAATFIYWLLLRCAPRGAALAFAVYMLIGAWATAEGRFDLVPAALTLLCVIAAGRKHWTYAYIALALGFLLKIYPLLFLPALFIAEQLDAQRFYTPRKPMALASLPGEVWETLRGIRSWRWKNTLIFFGILLGVTGFFALLDFRGAVLSQLSYFANRPVQVESTASPFLFLATHFGFAGHTAYTFGSINIVSPLGEPVSLFFDALLVLGYLFTIYLQWRGKLDITQAFIAILLIFIITGKVFSPQYLLWLIPLLVYSGAYDRFWLITWGLISLLTTVIYPYLYTRTTNGLLAPYLPGFIETVTARDALLVFLTLAYLFNWFHARRGCNANEQVPS
ncbi:MAG TPA: glycosyltransferase family 87 protein [Ktedonobacteraceae bacterium]|nr:glycosyltransferase family 87 protein [Ktedonobacteraceae bacterium]